MSVTKNMNLGNSDTIVNVTATGNIVGENIKSKGSATEPVYFDANGVAQVAIIKDSKTDTYSTATSDTNGRWTVTIPGITEYYDGLTIKIYLQKSYNSTFNTININGLGEKLMWLTRNNRLTTHYAQYSILSLTYSASNAGSYSVSYTYCDPVNSANYRGKWAAGTAYAIGDSVLSDAKYYICVVAHTSSTSINTTNFKASTAPYSSLALPGVNNEIRDGFIVESARDTDTTTVLNHSNSSLKVSNDSNIRLSGYNLFGLDKNGNIIPFSLYQAGYTSYTSSINQNRVYQDQGFDFTKGIFYNNNSSGFNAGSNYNTTIAETHTGIELRYTDNCVGTSTANTLGLVMNKLIYFRGIIKEDGLFYLDPIEVTYNNKTYKRCWTQDIPTTEEYVNDYRCVYWLIGCPYYNSSYLNSLCQINLFITNTLYWYNNGKFEEYKDLCLDNGQALKWMHDSSINQITPYRAIYYADARDSENNKIGTLNIGTDNFFTRGNYSTTDSIVIGHEQYNAGSGCQVSIKSSGLSMSASQGNISLNSIGNISSTSAGGFTVTGGGGPISIGCSSTLTLNGPSGVSIGGNTSVSGTLTVGTADAKKNTYINGTILTSGGNIYIQHDSAALCLGKSKEMIGADGDRILFYDYKTLDGENGTLRTLLCVKYDDSTDKYINYFGHYGYNNDIQIGLTGSTNTISLNGAVSIGNTSARRSVTLNGNLYLRGNSSGTSSITTTASNLSSPDFSASTVGQVYLLTLNNTKGSGTYIVHCGTTSVTINTLGSLFTNNAITVAVNAFKITVKSASSTISTTYRWTRLV